MTVEIREATRAETPDLAMLRWRSTFERHPEAAGGSIDEYVRSFSVWWEQRADYVAVVVADGTQLVGVGFLALPVRVPVPGDLDRRTGDIQSVYVLPEYRNQGIGSRLVRALVDHGRKRGCSRVTVHSGSRAVPVYERAGFEHDRHLMVHPLTD